MPFNNFRGLSVWWPTSPFHFCLVVETEALSFIGATNFKWMWSIISINFTKCFFVRLKKIVNASNYSHRCGKTEDSLKKKKFRYRTVNISLREKLDKSKHSFVCKLSKLWTVYFTHVTPRYYFVHETKCFWSEMCGYLRLRFLTYY